jgi:hypothetical protein
LLRHIYPITIMGAKLLQNERKCKFR